VPVRSPGPARRFTLGSGPLKRTSDRLQFLSRVLLVLTALAVAPLGALVAAHTSGHLHAVAREQAASRSLVTATLLGDAGGEDGTVRVTATWATTDGVPHAGRVAAPAGSRAGTVVRVWVDRSGAVTSAPMADGDVAADTIAAVILGPGVVLGLAGLAHVGLVAALDRRRLRRWAADWAEVEPLWRAGSR
jgi:hypothetical protein